MRDVEDIIEELRVTAAEDYGIPQEKVKVRISLEVQIGDAPEHTDAPERADA